MEFGTYMILGTFSMFCKIREYAQREAITWSGDVNKNHCFLSSSYSVLHKCEYLLPPTVLNKQGGWALAHWRYVCYRGCSQCTVAQNRKKRKTILIIIYICSISNNAVLYLLENNGISKWLLYYIISL